MRRSRRAKTLPVARSRIRSSPATFHLPLPIAIFRPSGEKARLQISRASRPTARWGDDSSPAGSGNSAAAAGPGDCGCTSAATTAAIASTGGSAASATGDSVPWRTCASVGTSGRQIAANVKSPAQATGDKRLGPSPRMRIIMVTLLFMSMNPWTPLASAGMGRCDSDKKRSVSINAVAYAPRSSGISETTQLSQHVSSATWISRLAHQTTGCHQ